MCVFVCVYVYYSKGCKSKCRCPCMDPLPIPVHQLLSLKIFLLLKAVKNRIPKILDDSKEIHDFDYKSIRNHQ